MVSNDVGPYCWIYVLIRLVGRFAGGALQHALAFFDAMRSGDVSAPPVRPATPARFGYCVFERCSCDESTRLANSSR
jgi:hypothetical protein